MLKQESRQSMFSLTIIQETSNDNIVISECISSDGNQIKLINLGYSRMNLEYELYDLEGLIINHQKLKDNSIEIPLNQFPPSTYFLRVMNNRKPLKTCQIIKT
jgi:hypothetical protein